MTVIPAGIIVSNENSNLYRGTVGKAGGNVISDEFN